MKISETTVALRPDDRPTDVVRHWFDEAFATQDYPDVGWALGSDWGMGSRPLSAEEYKAAAYKRFAAIYRNS